MLIYFILWDLWDINYRYRNPRELRCQPLRGSKFRCWSASRVRILSGAHCLYGWAGLRTLRAGEDATMTYHDSLKMGCTKYIQCIPVMIPPNGRLNKNTADDHHRIHRGFSMLFPADFAGKAWESHKIFRVSAALGLVLGTFSSLPQL